MTHSHSLTLSPHPSPAHTHMYQPFHAYEHGNLNWEAAFEVEAATLALTLRYWPNEVFLLGGGVCVTCPDYAQLFCIVLCLWLICTHTVALCVRKWLLFFPSSSQWLSLSFCKLLLLQQLDCISTRKRIDAKSIHALHNHTYIYPQTTK